MSPKVFVSHASEDKERFVLGFATRLRARGIDAWLDRWEMQPGESLVDQVFEEGLKEASVVIVVLSRASVAKPWVREELNAAVLKRINAGIKVIPVVIDDCEVPEALKSTIWERIDDLTSYDASLDRIVAAILGVTDRPPLGALPDYAKPATKSIGRLAGIDGVVLRLSCDAIIAQGGGFVEPESITSGAAPADITEAQLRESLEVLEEEGMIVTDRVAGGVIIGYRPTTAGMEAYAQAVVPAYDDIVKRVVSGIVNSNVDTSEPLAQLVGTNEVLVLHILDRLEGEGYLRQEKGMGARSMVYGISPRLRRLLDA